MTKRERFEIISGIADRALNRVPFEERSKRDKLSLVMDIDFADKDCPLRLRELAQAPDFDFAHDVFGIERHLNRTTKKLQNCFVPRFAA